jgi:hypothetical protein
MKKNNKKNWDIIEALVQRETDAVYKVLPEGTLRSRLESFMEKKMAKKQHIPPVFLKPLPIILPTFVFVCLVIAGLLLIPTNTRKDVADNPVEIILQQASGMNSLVRIENLYKGNLRRRDYAMLKSKSDIEKLFQILQSLRETQSREEHDFTYGKLHSHLELADLIRILIKEKTIHKVFLKYREGFKEEDNDSENISLEFNLSAFCRPFNS